MPPPYQLGLEYVLQDNRKTEVSQTEGPACLNGSVVSPPQSAGAAVTRLSIPGVWFLGLGLNAGLITPVSEPLRYRTADVAFARALEVRLQRHIEAHVKALYKGKGTSEDHSTQVDMKLFRGSTAPGSPASPSRPRRSVFFARDAATEVYRLLRQFEEARTCMAWQQRFSADEKRMQSAQLGSRHQHDRSPRQYGTTEASNEPPSDFNIPAGRTLQGDRAGWNRGEDQATLCATPQQLEEQLHECLQKYSKGADAPYAIPLHFNRMDKNFVWQLLENTDVFLPAPPRVNPSSVGHSAPGSPLEGCLPDVKPPVATVAVVVRVFAYPCGVYSGWVCAARLA